MNVITWRSKLYTYYLLVVYESALLQEQTSPHSQCVALGRPHYSSVGPNHGDREMKTKALQPHMALMLHVSTGWYTTALGCLCPVWSPGHMRLL